MRLGGQRHAPAALPQGFRYGAHFTGKCVGLAASLEAYRKSRACWGANSGVSSP